MKSGYLIFKRRMKKFLLSLTVACAAAISASAQLNGDGFYRAKNVYTGRYITVKDNHGKINTASTSVDAAALETSLNWDYISSDPGSIIYIQKQSNGEYNIMAQGTSVHDMIGYYVKLTDGKEAGSYRVWQTHAGMTIYLTDTRDENPEGGFTEEGFIYSDGKKTMDWNVIPVSSSTDNYIGIKPTVNVGDKYYAAYFNGFSFEPASDGMKVMYITKVDEEKGFAVYKEVTGKVPQKSPVIVECSSSETTNNRINPLLENTSALSGNMLQGNYFNVWNIMTGHKNRTAYDSNTMRVIGVCSNGRAGLVKSATLDYLPANSSYLTVSANCVDELVLVTEEEYATGINEVKSDDVKTSSDIYNMAGVKVRSNASTTAGLPQGIYLFKGKKVVVE